jgi:hypothetical protein
MTLQASGTITLAQIQAEFGGANPIYLSEYYRGGAYVSNTTPNLAIPTSGTIDLADFYGASAAYTVSSTLTHGSYVYSDKVAGTVTCAGFASGLNINFGVRSFGAISNASMGSVVVRGAYTLASSLSQVTYVMVQGSYTKATLPFTSVVVNGQTYGVSTANDLGFDTVNNVTSFAWTGLSALPATGTSTFSLNY